MRWYVIIKIKVLCPRSGSQKSKTEMIIYVLCKTLVPWLCSRSQPGIKGLFKGPLEAFVTYCNISCFQISLNLAGNQQWQEISIEFHYEQNQIMPLGVISPCFQIGFNLADN